MMRSSIKGFSILLLLGNSLIGCSAEPDIRSHLGNGDEQPPKPIAEDESIFIEVRGDHYDQGDLGNNLAATNVFIEIRPDRMIHSRRFTATWTDDYVPELEIESLDHQPLSEGAYQTLRQSLSAYGPAAHSEKDLALTPKDCAISIGGVSQAFISFGSSFQEANGRFVFPSHCESPSSQVVKHDLNSILARLPPLKGLEGYRID